MSRSKLRLGCQHPRYALYRAWFWITLILLVLVALSLMLYPAEWSAWMVQQLTLGGAH